jgi:hypothetical protein
MIRVNATRYARVACSIPLIRRGAKRFRHLAEIVEKHDRRAEKGKLSKPEGRPSRRLRT